MTALGRSLGLSVPASRLHVAGAAALADIVAFALISRSGASLEITQALSFAAALALGALLSRRAALARVAAHGARPSIRIGDVLVVLVLAYVLRAGILSLLAVQQHWPPLAAIVPAALAGVLVASLGTPFFLRDHASGNRAGEARLRSAVALCVAYLVALRLVYLGQIELIPQEAYYWNYSQHPDIGYVDHPPLIAWLIAAVTQLGAGEFFVRFTAVACWIVMIVFIALYARDLGGTAAALRATLLACTLPYFFIIGVIITPDAPLAAAWAAALYFLRRALLDGEDGAWLPAGIAIGLGMMSKYTMALVPIAALVFVLIDAKSRRVLISPWAWGGVALALAIFSPVIVWNMQHGWASFTFQSVRRLADVESRFSTHLLAGWVLLWLTPWGIAAFVRPVVHPRPARESRTPAELGFERVRATARGARGSLRPRIHAGPARRVRARELLRGNEDPLDRTNLDRRASGHRRRASRRRGAHRRRPSTARSREASNRSCTACWSSSLSHCSTTRSGGWADFARTIRICRWAGADLRAQVQVIEDAVLAETGRVPRSWDSTSTTPPTRWRTTTHAATAPATLRAATFFSTAAR